MLRSEESSLKSIAEHFEELPDPRSEVNREHLLVDVIVISICAILAGADGPTAIAVWAKSPSVAAWLKQHLALPKGIPSKDTYRRVLQSAAADDRKRFSVASSRGCSRSWERSECVSWRLMARPCDALTIGSTTWERCTS